ncbi:MULTISPECIES: hypothetical protein [unclassified Variovorax]|uniref:hypothetical protein n=1 Tax=unclassified Variovorax TaxID=663243 RepID=UPI00076D9F96|nr:MULTISPECIES: hypothetical protein [unclassified Variovorax]KWT98257.1 hypothetical protein APY03_0928 [Variovorax sp. WDL1]VTU42455.1 hypothetical protein SRS16P1_00274 [Variovorax sp. SRS16]VTU42482.1 hypothetical protein E5P1_00272 [Variovorax sp. PBL-E5]
MFSPIVQVITAVATACLKEPAVRRLATAVAVSLGLSLGAFFSGTHGDTHGGGHEPEPTQPPAPIQKREHEERFAPHLLEAEFNKPRAATTAHIMQGAESEH